jgi:hypothetical protein
MGDALDTVFVCDLRANAITASIAHKLTRVGDDYITRVACWYLAYKFEEVETVGFDDLVACGIVIDDVNTLVNAEREVLRRENHTIPFRTSMRKVSDSLGLDFNPARKELWLHILSWTRMTGALTAEEWVPRFKTFLMGTHFDPIFQLVASMLPEHFRKSLKLPKYLKYCRKRFDKHSIFVTQKRMRVN